MARRPDYIGAALGQALAQLGSAYGQKLAGDRQKEEANALLGNLLNQSRSVQDIQPNPAYAGESYGLPMLPATRQEKVDPFSQENPYLMQALMSQNPYAKQALQGLLQVRQMNEPKVAFGGPGEVPFNTRTGQPIGPQIPPKMEKPTPHLLRTERVKVEGGPGFEKRYFGYLDNAGKEVITSVDDQSMGRAISPFAGVNAASNMRKEFQSRAEVKYFNEIAPRYKTMLKAFDESTKKRDDKSSMVAVDQALITLFNKMTDPSSVVRESEYARTPEDMALLDRAKALASRWTRGGRLEPGTREALKQMADRFFEVAADRYKVTRGDYDFNAKSSGLDPKVILGTDMAGEIQPQSSGRVKKLEDMTQEELDAYEKKLTGR